MPRKVLYILKHIKTNTCTYTAHIKPPHTHTQSVKMKKKKKRVVLRGRKHNLGAHSHKEMLTPRL